MELLVRTIGLLLVVIISAWALWRGGEWPVIVFIFLAPLSYFSRTLGIGLTPAKVMGLVFIFYILVNPKVLRHLSNKYFGGFKYYFLYSIFVTLVMVFFWPDYSIDKQSFLYSKTMRGYVQIFQVVMGIAIIAVFLNSLTTVATLFRMQLTMLYSMIFLSVYGIYVWFAQRLGLPYNPISRPGLVTGSRESYLIYATINGEQLARAYSLSGEPKTLAINACWGVVLTYFTKAKQATFFKGFRGELILIPLFMITLYLTVSTAGYMILPMAIFSAVVIHLWVGQLRGSMIMRFLVLLALVIPFAYFNNIEIGSKMSDMYETRVEQRLSGEEGLFTFAEDAIIKFWVDQPAMAISGVGLGGSAFYVRKYDTENYAGYVASPRGIVGFVSDSGLIGLFLFLYGLAKSAGPLIHASSSASKNRAVYAGILVICGLSLVAIFTVGQWQYEWVLIGLMCSGATIAERELNSQALQSSDPEILV